MSNRIYVGNVNFRTTEEALQGLFADYGDVVSVRMIPDRDTGRFRGFSFVEMATEEQANAAKRPILVGRPVLCASRASAI